MFSLDQETETITVQPYIGEGARGPVYGPPVDIIAAVDGTRQLVRGRNGDEVVSESRLRISPRSDLDVTAVITSESQVTVHGHPADVVSVKPILDRGLLVYLEINLA